MLLAACASARRRPVPAPFYFMLPPDGWRYQGVTSGDTSDYSAEAFDDSGWATGSEPFCSSVNHPYAQSFGYPIGIGVNFPTFSKMWCRHRFTVPHQANLSVRVFCDDAGTVWVNGVLVMARASTAVTDHAITIPSTLLHAGDNVVALLAEDTNGAFSYACFNTWPLLSS